PNYADQYANYEIAQNSWNLGFFESLTAPAENGIYDIEISVYDSTGSTELGSNSIRIQQIPEPTAAILGLLGLVCGLRRRR
ncbi:MAG: PEP-CTERM sorting domain-containing protein, partial [Verrucomicrobiales bacterium]